MTFFAGTFVRHPLDAGGVHARCCEHLKQRARRSRSALNATCRPARPHALERVLRRRGRPLHVERFALRSVLQFPPRTTRASRSLLFYHLRERGVSILEGFPCFLTTAHSDEDIDYVVDAFRETSSRCRTAASCRSSRCRRGEAPRGRVRHRRATPRAVAAPAD